MSHLISMAHSVVNHHVYSRNPHVHCFSFTTTSASSSFFFFSLFLFPPCPSLFSFHKKKNSASTPFALPSLNNAFIAMHVDQQLTMQHYIDDAYWFNRHSAGKMNGFLLCL